ncbi:Hypothetical predicted protein, partial [Podarcis lilfordi]
QSGWLEKLSLAEFAYNNAMHVSTGRAPFVANYGLHPRAFPGQEEQLAVPAAEQMIEELRCIHEILKEDLEEAKEAYKKAADRHRRVGEEIQVGSWVWLSTKGLPIRGRCKKLEPRRLGPFQVKAQINPVAFKLHLPENMRIHPVFHRSLLSVFVPAHKYQISRGPPPFPTMMGEEETEVEEILDSRISRRKLQYLVAWKGLDESENSWEPAEKINVPELQREFHRKYPHKPKPHNWHLQEIFEETDSEEEEFIGFCPSETEESEKEEGGLRGGSDVREELEFSSFSEGESIRQGGKESSESNRREQEEQQGGTGCSQERQGLSSSSDLEEGRYRPALARRLGKRAGKRRERRLRHFESGWSWRSRAQKVSEISDAEE